jgi:hypothetical protein
MSQEHGTTCVLDETLTRVNKASIFSIRSSSAVTYLKYVQWLSTEHLNK